MRLPPMNGSQKVPVPTLARLATYYSVLKEAEETGIETLNSAKIEALCGIAATQIRKDLSRFGELGKPGVGYEVTPLRQHIEKILKLDRVQKVAIIGAGRLGQALAAYPGLASYSFEVVALFDSDARKVGKTLSGHLVRDVRSLASVLPSLGARIIALAVPASAAQGAADAAIAGGARWILNFAPAHIKTPSNCLVRNVSFTQEFAVLAHYSEDK
ncbi:MAG: redox-sensing transcriptional repressor Rex [Fimbriimonadales bacterium]